MRLSLPMSKFRLCLSGAVPYLHTRFTFKKKKKKKNDISCSDCWWYVVLCTFSAYTINNFYFVFHTGPNVGIQSQIPSVPNDVLPGSMNTQVRANVSYVISLLSHPAVPWVTLCFCTGWYAAASPQTIGPSELTLNVWGPSYLGITRSISWLLMPWLLTSPGHQQTWYWLCRICKSWSYLRKDFKFLCHINVE